MGEQKNRDKFVLLDLTRSSVALARDEDRADAFLLFAFKRCNLNPYIRGIRPRGNGNTLMNYQKYFCVAPKTKVRLRDFDPQFSDKHEGKHSALAKVEEFQKKMAELQYQLYAEQRRSLLIILQAPDAGGKDGVIRHVLASMNPQGCRVVGFKQPSAEESAHDFLWRIERQTPRLGELVIFKSFTL